MIYIVLNAGPIVAATIAGLAIGVGYLALFGPALAARRSAALLATAVFAEGWLACILAGAVILAPPQADPWVMAVGSAFIIWVGFVAPALVATHRARGLAWRATLLDAGHWLAVMLVQAAVLRAIGVEAPPR